MENTVRGVGSSGKYNEVREPHPKYHIIICNNALTDLLFCVGGLMLAMAMDWIGWMCISKSE